VAFPARLLNEGERVVLSTRTHVKVLLGAVLRLLLTAFLAALVLTLVSRYVDGDSPRQGLQLVISLLALVVFVWVVLRPFLRWYTTTYTFTDRRFIERSGFIARQGRTIPLNRISGVDYEQGVTDRLLGCGTLVVSDASETGTVPLRDIPHVEEAQRIVAEELHRTTSGDRVGDDGT
jgi:uncharacterized membrane protein YdbT with pleckstrin-like domain